MAVEFLKHILKMTFLSVEFLTVAVILSGIRLPMFYDGDNLIDQSGDYSTYLFSDRAEEILRKPSSEPKFIYVSYTAPHAPHYAPEDLQKMIRKELEALNPGTTITEEFVTYQAMIRAVDIGVEQIYKTAHEIIDRETIIIFGSDNGAATSSIRLESDGGTISVGSSTNSITGCNFPLRGKKSSLSEGGVRIPLLLTSTKRQLASVKRVLNHSIDWFATMLDLARVKNIPTTIDGISLAKTVFNPELSDKESKIRDRLIIGVLHHFNPEVGWKIQFAVIYKGFKFYNQESKPGQNQNKNQELKPGLDSLFKCPAFKEPKENFLGFKNGITEQENYFKHLKVMTLAIVI